MQFEGERARPDQLGALALYNYGHFTSMRAEHQRVRGLGLHLQRLVDDARQLFGTPVDPDHIRELIRAALRDGPDPVIVRVTVYAPDLDLAHLGRQLDPKILITTRPAPPTTQPPLRVAAVQYERDLPAVKHVGLFGQLLQRRAAQLDGFDDVVFVDTDGLILEGATWNIGFIRDGQVLWPKADVLPGTAMRLLQAALRATGQDQTTAPVRLADLPGMQAAFLTNAATGVRAIHAIDDTVFPGNPQRIEELRDHQWATPSEPV
jgi:branched-subunit amino acid aminotransferase/4-amino-4-deoxychorismate lyase